MFFCCGHNYHNVSQFILFPSPYFESIEPLAVQFVFAVPTGGRQYPSRLLLIYQYQRVDEKIPHTLT